MADYHYNGRLMPLFGRYQRCVWKPGTYIPWEVSPSKSTAGIGIAGGAPDQDAEIGVAVLEALNSSKAPVA